MTLNTDQVKVMFFKYAGADPGFEKGGVQVARGRVFGHI